MLDLKVLLEIVNAVGVVGVLIFMVYAFYRGHIISRAVLDDIITAVVKRVLEELDPNEAMSDMA